MNTGKCPKCENTLNTVDVEHVGIQNEKETIYNGHSYLCPHCNTVLGIAVDPLSIIRRTVKAIRDPEED